MGMMHVNTDPTTRQLKQFGWIWLGFLGLFGALALLRFGRPTAAAVLWALAVTVPAIGWVWPRFMRVVFVGLSYAAWPIGVVISHVLLGVVYYLVLTPIGILMRVVGYDAMKRRFEADADTYWVRRPGAANEAARYFRQF